MLVFQHNCKGQEASLVTRTSPISHFNKCGSSSSLNQSRGDKVCVDCNGIGSVGTRNTYPLYQNVYFGTYVCDADFFLLSVIMQQPPQSNLGLGITELVLIVVINLVVLLVMV